MSREPRNLPASVRDRLLNLARTTQREFQLVLTHYALERLLYRLSLSPYRERFVLKGALLFTIWLDDPFRPTRDVDLLGEDAATAAEMRLVFQSILDQAVEADGLTFDTKSLRASAIREDDRYGGIRVETTAILDRARVPIQVDIGFGDAVTPRADEISYPTLLDTPRPRLRAYPPETVIAEKLEAIVSLGFVNTRMKDFYDIAMMARHFDFSGNTLARAIRATFLRRRTPLPAGVPDGLSEDFSTRADVQARWRAFNTRERLTMKADDFPQVVREIRDFVLPPLRGALDNTIPQGNWTHGFGWRD